MPLWREERYVCIDKLNQSSFTTVWIHKVWMGLSACDDFKKVSIFSATKCCPWNLFSRWGVKATLQLQVPFLSACLLALLADQQVRICLSGIFPTGLGWDELWCDTLPSVLLGSQGDQDKSPCCPTGDMLRSCFSCFWGPDQDAEDLDTTWYCIPWEVRTVYKGGAQQNYVRRWDNILKCDGIIQRVIIHYSALLLSHTI